MKTILFLDVDGVFSLPNPHNYEERHERWPHCGAPWPIPMASALLRIIAADSRILPVWMSCWREGGHEWTDRAGIARFAVGYDLCKTVQTKALQRFPEGRDQDKKLLAVKWFLRERTRNRVVWIEDGFAAETKAWASTRGNVCLVDTWPYDGEIATFLRWQHEDTAQAARTFLRYCLGNGFLCNS